MQKWLQDSYNGLYKVLLEPVTPRRLTVLALVIGVLIGLFWAYVLQPVVFYDADPRSLHQSWQDEWVLLLSDRNAAANADVSEQIRTLLRQIDDPVGTVNRLIAERPDYAGRLQPILSFAQEVQAGAALAPQPSLLGNLLPYLYVPLLFAIVFVVITWLWKLLIYPNTLEPLLAARRRGSDTADAGVEQVREVARQRQVAQETLKTDFATTTLGKPLMQRMSVYIPGRGQFDDSFSIEDDQQKFLGECGAGISDTIGAGGENVTAVEVWLFDKDDFVRTITHVFASEHAYADAGIRSKLDGKGPVVIAQPGATTVLETASLRLQARIVEIEYGTGALPPNSHFSKLTIELAAWRKQAAGTPAAPVPPAPLPSVPPPAPLFPSTPTVQAAPPPQSFPMTPPPTPLGGSSFAPLRPISPPTPPPEDDPFGGTGDFKPIR